MYYIARGTKTLRQIKIEMREIKFPAMYRYLNAQNSKKLSLDKINVRVYKFSLVF
jgi:hypothetical protein